MGGKTLLGPRRTQFLCRILCGRVRKARTLGRGRNLTWERLAGYIHLVNAQYTSYIRMERIESSAVSVSMEHTGTTFWLIYL